MYIQTTPYQPRQNTDATIATTKNSFVSFQQKAVHKREKLSRIMQAHLDKALKAHKITEATGNVPWVRRSNGTGVRRDFHHVMRAGNLAQRLSGKAPEQVENFMTQHDILSFLQKT